MAEQTRIERDNAVLKALAEPHEYTRMLVPPDISGGSTEIIIGHPPGYEVVRDGNFYRVICVKAIGRNRS